ncbi:MAG: hypothetical protein PHN68_05945, partial [Prolixibacteraceae bacterium]|nr:hypothetical protein [Prolixibacteraceae bacterium]
SLKALDLVVANLLTRLFSGNSLETVMGNRNNADQLFNHLIHGPNAPDSTLPANPVTPNGIIARMVGPLWSQIARIAPVIPSATGSAITGDMPSLFGIPERIPEITYIVNALPGDNGFISSATNYHQAYGLSPHSFQSLEGLVGAIRTPDSHIGRLRIVGHVGLSDDSLTANLNAQFFNEGPRIIPEAMLRGFGISDEAGLRSILDDTDYLNPTAPVYDNLITKLLRLLYQLHPDVMVPFGNITSGSLTGDFQQLIFACSDLLYVLRASVTIADNSLSDTNRNRIRDTIHLLFNIFRDRLVGITVHANPLTANDMDTLRTAVEGITLIQFAFLSDPFPIFGSLINRILSGLRFNTILLNKFCLSTNGPASGSDLEQFLNICSDLLYLELVPNSNLQIDGNQLTNSEKTNLTNALNTAANHVRGRIEGTTICGSISLTATDVDDLKSAILDLSISDLGWTSTGNYTGHGNTSPIFDSLINRILSGLRFNTILLNKFCLSTNGPASGSDLEQFMKICSDLLYVHLIPENDLLMDGNQLTASQKTNLTSALNTAANHVRGRIEGTTICRPISLTETDINNLRSAILRLSLSDLDMTSLGNFDTGTPIASYSFTDAAGADRLFSILNTANAAMGRYFRRHLNQVKARFDENSWIDIRGCRIGQDTNYLEALRIFFGRPDHLPSVSGPEWWQSFPSAGFIPLADEAAVDTLWGSGDNTGHQGHTARDIQDVFDRVRSLSGVDIHIDFWKDVSNFSNFRFVAQVWKGELQPLPMQAPRLSDFNSLNFTNTINRISEIFNLAGSAPTGATLTRIQNNHTVIAALQSEVDNIQQLSGQSSPSSSALLASHNRLHAISTDLGQTTVPASAPAGLTAAQLSGWASALVTSVDTDIIGGGNNNTEIETFRQALHAKVNIPESDDSTATGNGRSDFRYYFFIGLPLLVEPLNNWFFYVLHAQRNEAIRSFMRAHWQDVLPTGNQVAASNINHERARQLSILTERDDTGTDTDDYVNPYPEFNQHIITRQ